MHLDEVNLANVILDYLGITDGSENIFNIATSALKERRYADAFQFPLSLKAKGLDAETSKLSLLLISILFGNATFLSNCMSKPSASDSFLQCIYQLDDSHVFTQFRDLLVSRCTQDMRMSLFQTKHLELLKENGKAFMFGLIDKFSKLDFGRLVSQF
jgi:hypothetical protein